MTPTVALAGRPNTGKTTLFNALTGLRQRVANFAGCTVEKASGLLAREGRPVEIVDLPGTFSVLPASEDERVALRYLAEASREEGGLLVACVCEASALDADLALALALKACGYRACVVVNMIDEAEQNGVRIDAGLLAESCGLPVFLVSARERRGVAELETFLLNAGKGEGKPPLDLTTLSDERLVELAENAARESQEVVNRCVRVPRAAVLPTIARSIRVDRWLLHPVAGPLVLAGALFGLFQALFALGAPAGELIGEGFTRLAEVLRGAVPSPALASLLCDGALPGVAAVLGFVPQIALLFLMIGALEQIGYLPRAGAMVDRALRPFGLDGRVFIPFLSSFACAIPGVMAARTIPTEKRRLTAVLLAPLMTCSARIPVYTLIIAAFVPASFKPLGLDGRGVVLSAMYALGVVLALLLALALRATPLGDSQGAPAVVLPPYRLPKPAELGRYVWARVWHFVERAGKVIFALSVLLWALAAFPKAAPVPGATPERQAQAQIEASLLGRAGRAIEPVFRPIGYDWRLSVGVASSLAAREVFVGTLGTLYALGGEADEDGLAAALAQAKNEDGSPRYGLPTAVSLLLFFAVALQCVSTIAVVRRETGGWRYPVLQFSFLFGLAYVLAFAGYRLTAWAMA